MTKCGKKCARSILGKDRIDVVSEENVHVEGLKCLILPLI
jgi:hypothetical protein